MHLPSYAPLRPGVCRACRRKAVGQDERKIRVRSGARALANCAKEYRIDRSDSLAITNVFLNICNNGIRSFSRCLFFCSPSSRDCEILADRRAVQLYRSSSIVLWTQLCSGRAEDSRRKVFLLTARINADTVTQTAGLSRLLSFFIVNVKALQDIFTVPCAEFLLSSS
jgi:hypothetical protein